MTRFASLLLTTAAALSVASASAQQGSAPFQIAENGRTHVNKELPLLLFRLTPEQAKANY